MFICATAGILNLEEVGLPTRPPIAVNDQVASTNQDDSDRKRKAVDGPITGTLSDHVCPLEHRSLASRSSI